MSEPLSNIAFSNTTSTKSDCIPIKKNKKLDTEEFKMLNLTPEYNFYKKILISLLTNFLNELESNDTIKFEGEIRATNDWLAEMFIDKTLTYVPIIGNEKCFIKNIINGKEIIIYDYSNMSDLTLKDCLNKMNKDLIDLYIDGTNE